LQRKKNARGIAELPPRCNRQILSWAPVSDNGGGSTPDSPRELPRRAACVLRPKAGFGNFSKSDFIREPVHWMGVVSSQ